MRWVLFLVSIAAFGQQATLDTFISNRTRDSGMAHIWEDFDAGGCCGGHTTVTIGGGLLTGVPVVPGPGTYGNGVAFWFQSCNDSGNFCYDSLTTPAPGNYVQSWIDGGTWSASINEARLTYSCAADIPMNTTPGARNVEWGTYVRDLSDPAPGNSGQGTHYYESWGNNVKANQTVFVKLSAMAQHRISDVGNSINLPFDPEWNWPEQGPSYPAHYYDGMTHFYFDAGQVVNNDTPFNYNTTCTFSSPTYYINANKEVPAWNFDVTGHYDPSLNSGSGGYELYWTGPDQGLVSTTWDLWTATSDIHTLGLASATSIGTQTGSFSTTGRPGVDFQSGILAHSSSRFFAIRPRMNIHNITATNPAIVTTWNTSNNLATSDTVTFSGSMTGSYAALNGTTQTVTNIPGQGFYIDGGGSLTSIVVNGSHIGTVTTSSAHGLVVGQYFIVAGDTSSGQNLMQGGTAYPISTVPSSTTFTFPANVAAPAQTYNNSGLKIYILDSFSVPVNATGFGTFNDASTAYASPSSNTQNFMQIEVDGTAATGGSVVNPGVKLGLNVVVH